MALVYMDNHATTRVDPRVVQAMLPFFTERYGNAASRSHRFGWDAETAVEAARQSVARLLGARSSREIVFTSGATESANLAIKGAVGARAGAPAHVLASSVAHKAVLDTCRRLERGGVRSTLLPVGPEGRIEPAVLEAAITEDTVLVSVMLANNEVGSVDPLEALGRITHARGVLLHVDAAQGLGLLPFHADSMHADLVSVSAHKMYGPKGVGALWVRRADPRVRLVGEMDGGGHERGLRSGTLNVPGIVGLGAAAELMATEGAAVAAHERGLRAMLRERLLRALDGVLVNGPDDAHRHPGNLNVSFEGVESEALMMALQDDVAVSSGSACTSASLEPSYVLRAMGIDEDRAHASIRFGLGRFNTEEEVDHVATRVIAEVRRLRTLV